MLDRIMGVIRLNVPTYEEIEHDEGATMQAAIIVLIVAIIGALGAYFVAPMLESSLESLQAIEGLESVPGMAIDLSPTALAIQSFVGAFVSWLLWSGVTMLVGTRVFGGVATFGEMLRVLGYAQAPNLISFVPCIGIIGGLWALVCGFIAVRQGLDLDNAKAAFTIILSWLAVLVVNLLLLNPLYAALG